MKPKRMKVDRISAGESRPGGGEACRRRSGAARGEAAPASGTTRPQKTDVAVRETRTRNAEERQTRRRVAASELSGTANSRAARRSAFDKRRGDAGFRREGGESGLAAQTRAVQAPGERPEFAPRPVRGEKRFGSEPATRSRSYWLRSRQFARPDGREPGGSAGNRRPKPGGESGHFAASGLPLRPRPRFERPQSGAKGDRPNLNGPRLRQDRRASALSSAPGAACNSQRSRDWKRTNSPPLSALLANAASFQRADRRQTDDSRSRPEQELWCAARPKRFGPRDRATGRAPNRRGQVIALKGRIESRGRSRSPDPKARAFSKAAASAEGTRQTGTGLPKQGLSGGEAQRISAAGQQTRRSASGAVSLANRRLTQCVPKAAHAADERGRAADGEADEVALVFARVNDHAGFNGGKRGAFVLRNAQLRIDNGIGVERAVDGREQSVHAFAGERRNGSATAPSPFGLEFVRESRAARSSSGSRSILLRTSMRGLERHSSSPRTFSTCAFCSSP